MDAAELEISSMISVRTDALHGSPGKLLRIRCDSHRPLHVILAGIWSAISDVVPAYTYGDAWVLRDIHTGRVYDVGLSWAKRNGFPDDYRALSDVGISPGAELEVVPAHG
jgi:hypothetical protein